MAENQVNVDYTIEGSQARKELDALRASLNKVTGEFLGNVKTIEKAIAGMTGAMAEGLNKAAERGSASYLSALRRQDQVASSIYNRAGQGGTNTSAAQNQANRAAGQAAINDITQTAQAVQAKVADTIVKTMLQSLRTSERMIEARIKQAFASQQQTLLNTQDRLMSARARLAEQRRADTIFAAENGRAALAARNRREQLDYNGGSELMGIQGRVMLNYAAVGGLFQTVKGLMSEIVALDKEFTNFQAISTSTNVEMVRFKTNLVNVAQAVPYTLNELAGASTTLAQAGATTSEVIKSIGSVAKFATASGSELGEAVDLVTSTMTAFNIASDRTNEVANTLTSALNLSKLSVDRLRTSLAYIGPTANEVGLTLQETVGVLGALAQSGIGASTIGTGTRALLVDLQNPSEKLQKSLKAAGLTIADVDVRARGFVPVIETLAKSGFGAAEAYESLELRAAAAFVALQNNLPLAYDMQRAFVLSSAATEAADIQMKSLSNTAKNFSSVVSGLAYTGVEPLINVFTGLIQAATGGLKILADYPQVLTGISTAAAVVGTALTVSLTGSLLRSLSGMIPLLASFGGGMAAAKTATDGTALATSRFGTILAGLSTMLRANWIGLTVTAVTLAVGAFMSWRNRADELTTAIDATKGRLNELQGAADATSKRITSIDQAIQGVIDRKAELEKNPLAFGAKVDELRSQFYELGLTITDNVTSVTDLVRELNNLEATSQSARAAQMGAVVSSSRLLLSQQQEQRKQLKEEAADPNGNNMQAIVAAIDGNARAIEKAAMPFYLAQVTQKFGPRIGEAAQFATGGEVRDGQSAISYGSYISAEIDRMRLENADKYEEEIYFLQSLNDLMQPLIANVTAMDSTAQNLKIQQTQQAESEIMGSEAAKTMRTRRENINISLDERRAAIDKQNLTTEQKQEAYRSLSKWYEKAVEASLRAFEREWSEEDNRGLDPSAASQVFKNILLKEKTGINAQLMGLAETRAKELTKGLRQVQQGQNKEIAQRQKMVGASASKEVLVAAAENLSNYMTASKEQVVGMYEDLIRSTADAGKREELVDLRDQYLEEWERTREDQLKAEFDQDLKIKKDMLELQKASSQDVAKGIQSKIDLAIDELKRTPPGAAMEALVQKIKELNQQLADQLGRIGGIDTQITAINLDSPISASQAGDGRDAVAHYLARGLSKNGAAAIAGNLGIESNFNPNALGDKGSAHGAAQWRGTRWNEMRSFAIERGKSERDLPTQYDFVLKELARDYPDLLKRLQAGTEDPQTLAAAFMNQFERPNKDPSINHIGKRQALASSLASADTSAATAAVEENQKKLTETVDTNNAKSIKQISDSTIKNLNARLGTLKTQARLNDDSASIQDIQKQIQAAHAEIEKAELAKFDAANVDLKRDSLAEFNSQRQELQEKLHDGLNNDVLKVMEEYYKAADEELNRPVDAAKAQLDAARQPDMANKYTATQIQALEQNVVDREREATANRVLLIEQQIAEVRTRAADAEKAFGTNSPEANMWRNQENDLIAKNNELKQQNNALDAAKAAQGPSVAQGIQAANTAWQQQNGILDQAGQMIPLGKQVESIWGQVLDGMSTGFSTFFTDLASGTMTAGDAFKKLGQTILGTFMDIISKQLANQLITSLMPGGGAAGGGGFLGSLLGVFTGGGGSFPSAPGAGLWANGGIPRAANGRSASPYRDNLLVNVMPGEGILRKSAMDMIGKDQFTKLNNLGNRQISEGALQGMALNNDSAKGQSGVVNVWVVSPEQVPPSGPNDIIATVADNIQRRGTIKKLIQQVQMGAV